MFSWKTKQRLVRQGCLHPRRRKPQGGVYPTLSTLTLLVLFLPVGLPSIEGQGDPAFVPTIERCTSCPPPQVFGDLFGSGQGPFTADWFNDPNNLPFFGGPIGAYPPIPGDPLAAPITTGTCRCCRCFTLIEHSIEILGIHITWYSIQIDTDCSTGTGTGGSSVCVPTFDSCPPNCQQYDTPCVDDNGDGECAGDDDNMNPVETFDNQFGDDPLWGDRDLDNIPNIWDVTPDGYGNGINPHAPAPRDPSVWRIFLQAEGIWVPEFIDVGAGHSIGTLDLNSDGMTSVGEIFVDLQSVFMAESSVPTPSPGDPAFRDEIERRDTFARFLLNFGSSIDPEFFGGVAAQNEWQESFEAYIERTTSVLAALDALTLEVSVTREADGTYRITITDATGSILRENSGLTITELGRLHQSWDGVPSVRIEYVDEDGNSIDVPHFPDVPAPADSHAGDPVDTWSGAFVHREIDLQSGLMRFERFYNSRDIRAGIVGSNWSMLYLETQLVFWESDDGTRATVSWGDGTTSAFELKPNGIYEGIDSEFGKIRPYQPQFVGEPACDDHAGSYMLRKPDGMLYYFCPPTRFVGTGYSVSWLRKVVDGHGNAIAISRGISGLPLTVTDERGLEYQLEYDDETQLLTQINGPAGAVVTYTYDLTEYEPPQQAPTTTFPPSANPNPVHTGPRPRTKTKRDLVLVERPLATYLDENNVVRSGRPFVTYKYHEHPDGFKVNPEAFLNHNLESIGNQNGAIVSIDYYEDESEETFDRVRSYRDAAGRVTTVGYKDLDQTTTDEYGQSPDRACFFAFPDGEVVTYFHGEDGHLLRRTVDNPDSTESGVTEWATIFTYDFEYTLTERRATTNLDPMGGRSTTWTYDQDNPDRFQQGNVLEVRQLPDHTLPSGPTELLQLFFYDPIHNRPFIEIGTDGNAVVSFFGHQELTHSAASALQAVTGWGIDLTQIGSGHFNTGDMNGDGVLGGTGLVVRQDYPPVDVRTSDSDQPSQHFPRELSSYDSFGRLISKTDTFGTVITTHRSPNGVAYRRTYQAGSDTFVEEMFYDERFRLLLRRERDDRYTQYVRDDFGNLLEIRELPNTHTAQVPVGQFSYPIYSGDPVVKSHWKFYDLDGNEIGVGWPLLLPYSISGYQVGNTVPNLEERRRYSADKKLLELTRYASSAAGTNQGNWTFSYDGQRRSRSSTTPSLNHDSGATTESMTYTNERDPRGLIVEISRRSESGESFGSKRFEYNEFGDQVSQTLPTDADGDGVFGVIAYNYDGFGRRIGMIDPGGVVHEYDLDLAGRPLEERLLQDGVLVGKTAATYNGLGQPVQTTASNLNSAGMPIVGEPALVITEHGYGTGLGQTTWMMVDRGGVAHLTEYEYDAWGRRVGTFVGSAGDDGRIGTRETLDAAGRTLTRTRLHHLGTPTGNSPASSVWTFEYDGLGRLSTQTDPLQNLTQYEFDGRDELVGQEDPSGVRYQTVRDSLGRKIEFTEIATSGEARTNEYEIDIENNLTTITDAADREISYDYDAAGRRTRRTFPDAQFEEYGYDDADRKISETRPGVSVTYGYTETGYLASTNATGADADVSQGFKHDAFGQITEASDVTGIRSPVLVYRANSSNGRVLAEATGRVVGGNPLFRTVALSYRANGTVREIIYPSGSRVEHDHDPIGRVTEIRHLNPFGVTSTVASFEDPYGESFLTATLGSTGGQFVREFDSRGRVTADVVENSSGAILAGSDYTYDEVGNLRCRFRRDSSITDRFDYDGFHRLAQWKAGVSECEGDAPAARTVEWQYDAVDNISFRDDTASTPTIPEVNELNQYQSFNPLTSITYSERGEQQTRIEDGLSEAWTYDALGRPFQHTKGTVTDFIHDPFGRLVGRKVGTDESFITYLRSDVLESFDPVGGLREYVYGDHGIWRYRVFQDERLYLYVDPFRNVEALHDGTSVSETFRVSPYGTPHAGTSPTGPILTASSTHNDLFFLSLPYFFDLGLSRLGARFYDPRTSGFTTRDALGEMESVNLYAYGRGNPYRFSDPSGLGAVARPGDDSPTINDINKLLTSHGLERGAVLTLFDAWIKRTGGALDKRGLSPWFDNLEALIERGEYGLLIEMGEEYREANAEHIRSLSELEGMSIRDIRKIYRVFGTIEAFQETLAAGLSNLESELDAYVRSWKLSTLSGVLELYTEEIVVPALDGITSVAPYVGWIPLYGWSISAIAAGRTGYLNAQQGNLAGLATGALGLIPGGTFIRSGSRAFNNFAWGALTAGVEIQAGLIDGTTTAGSFGTAAISLGLGNIPW